MSFSEPRGKTLGILAGRAATIMDKDYIAWLHAYGEETGEQYLDVEGSRQLLLNARHRALRS